MMSEEEFLVYCANYSAFFLLQKLDYKDCPSLKNLKQNVSVCHRFATIWSAPIVHLAYALYQLAKGLVKLACFFHDVDFFQEGVNSLKASLYSFMMCVLSIPLNFGDFMIEWVNQFR